MWQVDFAAAPSVLEDLKHLLKVLAAGMSCSTLKLAWSLRHWLGGLMNRQEAQILVLMVAISLVQVDDRIIRYVVLKREPFKPLPTTYRIARMAERKVAPGLQ